MSTARADEHEHDHDHDHDQDHDQDGEEGGIILTPEVEARLVRRLAEMDENERAGKLIPWETVRAQRGM